MIPFSGRVTAAKVKPVKQNGEVMGAEAVFTITTDLDADLLLALSQNIGKEISFTADSPQFTLQFTSGEFLGKAFGE